MKVYALVGKSGTGKSYQAMSLCKDKDIESIIDDGLFIYNNDAITGISAKRQPTKVGAIKTALFNTDEHKARVIKKIKEVNPQSVLVIGTSDTMVQKIVDRLELPRIEETVYIEEITTENEREIAVKQRKGQGKHVVPVPTFQLKRQFSGYFVDPLRIFRGWGTKADFSEKSVVRPTYSYMGDFIISDKVISDIVERVGSETKGVSDIMRVMTDKRQSGLRITVLTSMHVDSHAAAAAVSLQKKAAEMIEKMTAFNIKHINIEIRGLR